MMRNWNGFIWNLWDKWSIFGIPQNNLVFYLLNFDQMVKKEANHSLPPRTLSFKRWRRGKVARQAGWRWESFGHAAAACRLCLEEPLGGGISFWNLLNWPCQVWRWSELGWFFHRFEGFELFRFSLYLCSLTNHGPLPPFLGLCAFIEEQVHLSWKHFTREESKTRSWTILFWGSIAQYYISLYLGWEI